MPWSTTRPSGTQAKYRTPEHRAEVARLKREMARVGYLVCAQPECVMPSRTIERGQRYQAGHDDSGTVYIGPTHFECGVKDGAKRGSARSHGSSHAPKRWPT